MASRFFAIGTLTVLAGMTAGATNSALRHPHLRAGIAPGTAHLLAFGSRSAQQRASAAGAKFDGALADLSRHAALARPDHLIEDLRSLAPAARFKQTSPGATPLVLIDAVTPAATRNSCRRRRLRSVSSEPRHFRTMSEAGCR